MKEGETESAREILWEGGNGKDRVVFDSTFGGCVAVAIHYVMSYGLLSHSLMRWSMSKV